MQLPEIPDLFAHSEELCCFIRCLRNHHIDGVPILNENSTVAQILLRQPSLPTTGQIGLLVYICTYWIDSSDSMVRTSFSNQLEEKLLVQGICPNSCPAAVLMSLFPNFETLELECPETLFFTSRILWTIDHLSGTIGSSLSKYMVQFLLADARVGTSAADLEENISRHTQLSTTWANQRS